ncbi:FkbM family methyltransferase [Bacillus toyonensis]|uniref:FkbM family methyltransferase n=1 Tax=Bacillus toyonensis TaxID=155322 RepID=UPI002E1B3AD4|nr:FkbM family methyltransferase [Bacillus toyonensis]MED2737603.1 FkbM family methyltransferase [Bacillus toyonensis]
MNFVKGAYSCADKQKERYYIREVLMMHGTYMGNNRMLVRPQWGAYLFTKANDLSLTPILVAEGMLEPKLTKFMLKNITAGMKVIDVGANIGYYTVLLGHLVKEKGKVYSFEANAEMMGFLEDNVKVNYLNDRVSTFHNAVYSKADLLSFYIEEEFNGNSSLFEPDEKYFKQFGHNKVKKVDVRAISLDEKFNKSTDYFDLVKIDVEGGEYEVFKGMERLLRCDQIGKVVFEWNQIRTDTTEFKKLLKNLEKEQKYSFYLLDNESSVHPIPLNELFKVDFVDTVLMTKNI